MTRGRINAVLALLALLAMLALSFAFDMGRVW